MTHTHLRHETDRQSIRGRLNEVRDSAVDYVASPTSLIFDETNRFFDPTGLTEEGVGREAAVTLTRNAFRQTCERLDVPLKYADLLDEQQTDLLRLNLNDRASHKRATPALFRFLRMPDGTLLLRAVLSDTYKRVDNYDVFTAVASGLSEASVPLGDCEVEVDWTDDRFRMRIMVPQIEVAAPELLGGYRAPRVAGHHRDILDRWAASPGSDGTTRQGNRVGDVIWAGLEVANSETGNGSTSIAPRATVLACLNGMTRKADLVRSIHLGARLDQGVIAWSQDTMRKQLELVKAQVRDAASQFCSVEYLQKVVDELRAAKGIEITGSIPATFELAQTRLGFSEAETEAAMDAFMRSGDSTVFGLAQAFTAAAQTVPDGDRQTWMEECFWDIVADAPRFATVDA
jgi:hypothetical protein